jgi:hypothetical protein
MKRIFTALLAIIVLQMVAQAQPCIPNTSALDFDGIGSQVRISGVNGLEPAMAITVEAWINARAFGVGQSDNSIFCKHKWNSSTYGYVLRAGGNGILSFNIAGAVGGSAVGWKEVVSSPGALSLDTWYHVAATFDGDVMKCYVNGLLSGTTNFSGTINMSTGLVPRIGRLADTAWGQTRMWNGYIDEVRVWDRALSETEIQARMNDHIDPSIQTGLVGYWRLNDGSGNLVSDLGTGNNPGTMIGAAWTTNVPFNNMSLPTPVITWASPYLHSSYSYGNQWYLGSAPISGATQQNYTPTQYGTYRVRVTNDTTGCNALSAPFVYNTTAIPELRQQSLSLNPNPASGSIILTVPTSMQNASFLVSDLTGRALKSGNTGDNAIQTLDISGLVPGIYLLKVATGIDACKVLKFTVK